MASANELQLPHVPIETPEFAVDPMPHMDAARRQHPWLARSNLGFLITEYQAMRDVLARDDKLRMPGAEIVDIMGAHGTEWGRFVVDQMLVSSGERHDRLRGSISGAFTPRAVNRLRGLMQEVVADLLDEWAPKGAFDFVEFASQFPIRVMFGVIGADPAPIPEIQHSLEIHGSSFDLDTSRMAIIEAAYLHLWEFVDGVIAARRRVGPKGDLLDDLVAANTSGALSDVELRQILLLLFAAGYDTTKNMLTLIMHAMLQTPADWERCATDRAFCDKVVEEGLRFMSPSSTYRTVVEPLEYRDVVFPKDSMIIMPLSITGQDETAFPEGRAFKPERTHVNRQIAFGRGMHLCLGQFLARANMEEGIHLMAQRITKPRLAGEVTWRPFPGVWGVKSLPIAFDPA
jgi:cytochrome P450